MFQIEVHEQIMFSQRRFPGRGTCPFSMCKVSFPKIRSTFVIIQIKTASCLSLSEAYLRFGITAFKQG